MSIKDILRMNKKSSFKNTDHLKLFNNEVDVYIYGDIDPFWGFTANDLRSALDGAGPNANVNVYISSNGGSILEGLNIYNTLRSHKGHIKTINTSIAASMAGIIFLAGDTRQMYDNAMIMVHNPTISAYGDLADLQEHLDLLQKTQDNIINIYSSRTNQSKKVVEGWLDQRTDLYFQANEAMELGFATEILQEIDAVAKADFLTLVAKLQSNQKGKTMDKLFKEWLLKLGYDKPEDIPEKVLNGLKAKYDEETVSLTARGNRDNSDLNPNPNGNGGVDLEARRKAEAAEQERVDGIRMHARANSEIKLSAEKLKEFDLEDVKDVASLTAKAIREGWSQDKFELTLFRIQQPDVGGPAIHVNDFDMNTNIPALQCALCRASGMPSRKKNPNTGIETGYEVAYDDETLEASDNSRLRDISLLQVLHMQYHMANGHHYPGRLNTDAFLAECKKAMFKLKMGPSNTSWGDLDIFDDVANKLLWNAYNDVPTTWQKWVTTVAVNDFKTHNMYRLTHKQGYLKVGADGELKHGGFTDDKYTVSADTYGKMVGLTRKDIINDDLGALSNIMTALGRESARFLEELFYVYLMENLATIFPTGGTYNNYQSGAATDLGVDGLTTAEELFYKQVDDDGAPLMVEPGILLVGTQDAVIARELYKQTNLVGLQAEDEKLRPDGNPHVGKFEPVVSGYLNNTNLKQRTDSNDELGQAIPNQTSNMWFLLARPNQGVGGIIMGAFLNGNQQPTVEQSDQAFNVLGLQWRAYHDAGVGSGDPKLGVMSKGAG